MHFQDIGIAYDQSLTYKHIHMYMYVFVIGIAYAYVQSYLCVCKLTGFVFQFSHDFFWNKRTPFFVSGHISVCLG